MKSHQPIDAFLIFSQSENFHIALITFKENQVKVHGVPRQIFSYDAVVGCLLDKNIRDKRIQSYSRVVK